MYDYIKKNNVGIIPAVLYKKTVSKKTIAPAAAAGDP